MKYVKKKQHFVPRFYLKYFADLDNQFFTYDFMQGGLLPKRVYYESQCYKKYFYGEDGLLEERLSEKETKWAAACNKIVTGNELNEEDILLLKEFILYQKQRTSDTNNRTREERESLLLEYTRMIYIQHGWQFDDEAIELCKQRAAEEVTPAENVELAAHMLDYINDLALLIVHYVTSNTLLTTDAPVVTLNAFTEFTGFGYYNMGIVFFMPLSPEYLILMYDDHFYTRFKGKLFIESHDNEEVANINRYELIHAERMAFSQDIYNFNDISEQILNRRTKESERRKMLFLGPEGASRLMISQAEGTRYYYELPFMIFPREYHRIPYNCREPIPRHYEKAWGKKLSEKYKILSTVRRLPANSETKQLIPNKGDLRIGCRRMKDLAEKYWKSRGYNM